jgi:hypothetical protein
MLTNSALMLEAVSTSKTSANFFQTARRNVPEESHLQFVYLQSFLTFCSRRLLVKNSGRTAKKTAHFTVSKINRLTLFKEMIAVRSENYTKPVIKK